MPNSEPVPGAAETSRTRMLLDFVREHDADCPICGYNVRALTQPICPECGNELMLTVGAAHPHLGWLLAAVAPGFFSGIAAAFLLVMILARLLFGDHKMSLTLNVLDLFGWCSGVFAVILAIKRRRFFAQSRSRQRWWAMGIWFVHVA